MGSAWVNEYTRIKRKAKEKLTEYVGTLSEKNGIKHRTTVLMLGVICPESPKEHVDMWLDNLGMDTLTRRSQSDAFFLYVYESLRNISIEERYDLFNDYLDEYSRWKKYNGSIYQGFDRKARDVRNYLYSDITTFGELHDRLKRNSKETITGTMITIQTDKEAMEQLEEIVRSGKSLSDFLTYLKNEPSVQDYNRKSTLYLQKMLYDMIKYPLDLLCEHNLPEEDERRQKYIEAKNHVLKRTSAAQGAFNRYVLYNKLFLKMDNNEFRDWLIDSQETSVSACIDYLRNEPIYYNRLFTSFYNFIIGEKYECRERLYQETDLPDDVHVRIFGDCVQCDNKIIRFFKNAISGNIYIRRSFLILFAMYVGYDIEYINKVLKQCGYEELSMANRLDSSVIEITELEITKAMRDIVNTIDFLNNISEFDDDENFFYAKGEAQRVEYREDIYEIVKKLEFKNYISTEDERYLQEIFDKTTIGKIIFEFSDEDVEKIQKKGN